MIRFFLLLVLLAGNALAYNQNHRPFTPETQPRQISLTALPDPIQLDGSTSENPRLLFESTNAPGTRIQITRNGQFMRLDLSVDGRSILSNVSFSPFEEFGGQLEVSTADLNQDGQPDYVVSHWLGGCGLASGYYNLGFLLSSGDGYKLTVITALWPDAGDYMLIDGKPCILHTSFHEVDECTDGKNHGFWVYNLLVIEGAKIKIANQLHPDFPKTIWYSFADSHDETELLTDEQKNKLQADSLKQIFWSPDIQQPTAQERE
jgi:hypothetical protein